MRDIEDDPTRTTEGSEMKLRNHLNFMRASMLATGLLLLTGTPAVLAQMAPGGAPPSGGMSPGTPPGGMQPNGMQPNGMQPMGPNAGNNQQLAVENRTFANILRNIEVETKLSKMALKKSSNADVKNFAHQLIADNHKLEGKVSLPVSSAPAMPLAPEVPKQTKQAEKQMKKLSGPQFDQLYLIQMDAYIKNDRQVASQAAQQSSVPAVSKVGTEMQPLTEQHQKQIAQLTQEEHLRIQ
jgi:predicted outer membrane protein